jgi:hypothetical protein
MSKNRTITVNNIEITVTSDKEEDYISLTDMVRDMEDSDQLIKKWLSTKNTIEYVTLLRYFREVFIESFKVRFDYLFRKI